MKNLRLLREESTMSQYKLADQLELAQSQIQSYESGGYEPDIATLSKLADIFETSIDYLVGRTEIRHKIEPVEEYKLNESESILVEGFRNLSPSFRDSLLIMLKTLSDADAEKK